MMICTASHVSDFECVRVGRPVNDAQLDHRATVGPGCSNVRFLHRLRWFESNRAKSPALAGRPVFDAGGIASTIAIDDSRPEIWIP